MPATPIIIPAGAKVWDEDFGHCGSHVNSTLVPIVRGGDLHFSNHAISKREREAVISHRIPAGQLCSIDRLSVCRLESFWFTKQAHNIFQPGARELDLADLVG
jgi:hypothetical protein